MSDFVEVAQYQRQVMAFVDAADLPDAPDRLGIPDLTAERIARVRRVGDDAPCTEDRRRLADEPRLGMRRVNLEELGHGRSAGPRGPVSTSPARR